MKRRAPRGEPALLAAARCALQGFPRDAPALVAVSGGRDSMALLHALRRGLGFERLIVCHLDHGLREESARDAEFVRARAEELGCGWEGSRRDVAAQARRTRSSVETAAREARYRFLASAARRRRCPAVFLGHHADDRVETVLSNLFRGTGSAGLGALTSVAQRKIGATPLTLLRPLIAVWREEIDEYLATHGLAWREDASNMNRAHTRNRFRHDIILALEAWFGRGIRRAIWRTAEIAEAENACLDEWTAAIPLNPKLATAELAALPLALQRRTLQAWLRHQKVPEPDFETIEKVRSLLALGVAKVNLPGAWHARRTARRLWLEPPKKTGLRKAPRA